MAAKKKLYRKSNKVHRLYSSSELVKLVHHYSKLSPVERFQHYAALWELRMKFCSEEKLLQDRQKKLHDLQRYYSNIQKFEARRLARSEQVGKTSKEIA